ncbi:beta strand repeat-containing protein [Singulisphaera rosea]
MTGKGSFNWTQVLTAGFTAFGGDLIGGLSDLTGLADSADESLVASTLDATLSEAADSFETALTQGGSLGTALGQSVTSGLNALTDGVVDALSDSLISSTFLQDAASFVDQVSDLIDDLPFADSAISFLTQAVTTGDWKSAAFNAFALPAASLLEQTVSEGLAGTSFGDTVSSFLDQVVTDGLTGSAFAQGALSFLEDTVADQLTNSSFVQDVGGFLDQLGGDDFSNFVSSTFGGGLGAFLQQVVASNGITSDLAQGLDDFLQQAEASGLDFASSTLADGLGTFLQEAQSVGLDLVDSPLAQGIGDFLQQAQAVGLNLDTSPLAQGLGTFLQQALSLNFDTSPLAQGLGEFLQQAESSGLDLGSSVLAQGLGTFLDQAESVGLDLVNSPLAQGIGDFLQQAQAAGLDLDTSPLAQGLGTFLEQAQSLNFDTSPLAQGIGDFLQQAESSGLDLATSTLAEGLGTFLQEAESMGLDLINSPLAQGIGAFLEEAAQEGGAFLNSSVAVNVGAFLQDAGQAATTFANSTLGADAGVFLEQAAQDGMDFLNSSFFAGASEFLQVATGDEAGFLNSVVGGNLGTFLQEAAQAGANFAASTLGEDAGEFLEQAARDGVDFFNSSFGQDLSTFLDQALVAGNGFLTSTFAGETGQFLQEAAVAGVDFANSTFAQDAVSFLNQALTGSLTSTSLAQDALSYVNQTIANTAVGSDFANLTLPFLDNAVAIGLSGATFAQDVGAFVSQLVSDGLTDAKDLLSSVKVTNATLLTALGNACISQGYLSNGLSALRLAAQLNNNAGAVSLAQSLVTLSTTSIPYGTTTTVTLIARDATGHLETTGGLKVVFGLGGSGSSGTFSTVTDNGNGTYTATLTGTGVGSARTITATINGQAVTSVMPTITVTAAATKATVTASPGVPVFGQSVTFTATVAFNGTLSGNPGGLVTFFDGTTALGTGTFSTTGGVTATSTFSTTHLLVGLRTITASYAGTNNQAPIVSSPFSLIVGQDTTTAVVKPSLGSLSYGQSETFTATLSVSSPGAGVPTGTVTFKDGTSTLGTGTLQINQGIATATFTTNGLAVGSHSITAVYSGDANDLTTSSATLTLPVSINTTTVVSESSSGVLTVKGGQSGSADDTISLDLQGSNFVVSVDGQATPCLATQVKSVIIQASNGNNTININATMAGVSVTINLGSGNNVVNLSPTTRNLNTILGAVAIAGGSGLNTLSFFDTNDTINSTYTATSGSLKSSGSAVIQWSGISRETLVAGAGTNSLVGPNANSTWNITSGNAGSLGNLDFGRIANLTGGTGNDNFVFTNGANLSGTVSGGGGVDTIDDSANSAPLTVQLSQPVLRIGGLTNFSAIQNIVANPSNSNTIDGPNFANSWRFTGSNILTLNAAQTFSGFGNIVGGTDIDDFILAAGGSASGNLKGNGGADILDVSRLTTPAVVNLTTSTATGIGGTFSGIQSFVGLSTAGDTLIGPHATNSWNITGYNTGVLNSTIKFANFANLTGSDGSDTFVFSNGASLSGMVAGGGGVDTINDAANTAPLTVQLSLPVLRIGGLANFSAIQNIVANPSTSNTIVGPNIANTWRFTAADTLTLNGSASFKGFGNIVGGTGSDDFILAAGGSASGNLKGNGGADILDVSRLTTPAVVNLTTSTATGIGGTFSGIQSFIGLSTAGDTLVGPRSNNAWNITGYNSGALNNTITFANFANLTGGQGNDDFIFSNGATLSGIVSGGGGADTIDDSANTAPLTVQLNQPILRIGGLTNFNAIQNIIANASTSNTINGPNTTNTWKITGYNTATLNGLQTFSGFGNIVGGTSHDAFVFLPGGTLSGKVKGNGGADTLDVSGLTTPVIVNLETGSATNIGGGISGVQTFVGLASDGDTLIAPNTTNSWNLTGANSGNLNNAYFFTAFQTLVGGTGANTLVGPNSSSNWTITGNNAGSLGSLNFSRMANLTGGTGSDKFLFSNGASISGLVSGGGGVDTIDDSANSAPLTVQLSQPVLRIGGLTNFSAILNIVANPSNSNTIDGPNLANSWRFTGSNILTLNAAQTFSGFGNIVGGTDIDDFILAAGGSASGNLKGNGGADILDVSRLTTPAVVNLTTSSATGIGGTFSGIQSFIGLSTAGDTLVGPHATNSWNITRYNSGTLNGSTSFANFANLTGGQGIDGFIFSNGASLSGIVSGGGGVDTIDDSANISPLTVQLTQPVLRIGGLTNFSAIQNIVANPSTSNTIDGPNTTNTWRFNGADLVSLNGAQTFSGFGNIVGGTAVDNFVLAAGSSLSGNLKGNGGADILDLSRLTTPVLVNLTTSTATGIGGTINGIQAFVGLSTAVDTLVGPHAINTWNLTGYNTGVLNSTIKFANFANLTGGDGNDTFVFSSGASLSGMVAGGGGIDTIDDSANTAGLTVQLSQPVFRIGGLTNFSAIQNILANPTTSNTIVGPNTANAWRITGSNIVTLNGSQTFSGFGNVVGGTGNDAFVFANGGLLSGVLRGNGGADWLDYSTMSSPVTVNLTKGMATNVVGGISSIANVRGGSGGNTLTGNAAPNILIGGAGNDTLTAGAGGGILIGEAGTDVIQGGNGNDIVIGGTSSFDGNETALDAILAEWESSDSFAARIAQIRSGVSYGGPSPASFSSTTINLNGRSKLGGGSGNDWFWSGINDAATDLDANDQLD